MLETLCFQTNAELNKYQIILRVNGEINLE